MTLEVVKTSHGSPEFFSGPHGITKGGGIERETLSLSHEALCRTRSPSDLSRQFGPLDLFGKQKQRQH
jgi:hypothetical protein